MNTTIRSVFFLFACVVCPLRASVPTAEEYAHSLEMRFTNGESATSIRASFETNGLFTIHEIIPYCFDYTLDTNDLESSAVRYGTKIRFLDALLGRDFIEVSSNVFDQTTARLWDTSKRLALCIRMKYEENPTTAEYEHWRSLAPDLFPNTGRYGFVRERAFLIRETRMHAKDAHGFVQRISGYWMPCHQYSPLLNVEDQVFPRADLYAELSTNTQFNANAMFKYCLTDKGDFETNNIAIAEKQVWRNDFVLEIVARSCNLSTNAANRAHDADYTNRLAVLRAHYDALPAPRLGMSEAELAEWRSRLGGTIDAYIRDISPFRSPLP